MSRGAVTVGIHIFGVRHHGPGCARSLRAALEKLEPDIVLVEGPPDAQEALPWLVSEEMQPPVALLIYAPDKPQHAVFYPFTHFSPEWQALRYALKRGIPARFMDLPQAFQLAKEQTSDHADEAEETPQEEEAPLNEGANSVVTPARGAGGSQSSTQTPGAATETEEPANPRDDPFALLAQAEGFQRIAVVCGAWHAPALSDPGDAKTDAALLSGFKRIKVEATWIPWTNSRLSYRSGYGAGVTSPGWYEHLWTAPDRVTIRWITHAAHLLREKG